MKLLILGSSGLLGNTLTKYFFEKQEYETFVYLRYSSKLQFFSKKYTDRLTDYIDIRPRVSTYDPTSATKSPFEFDSRDFSAAGQAASVLVSDENINFDFHSL